MPRPKQTEMSVSVPEPPGPPSVDAGGPASSTSSTKAVLMTGLRMTVKGGWAKKLEWRVEAGGVMVANRMEGEG